MSFDDSIGLTDLTNLVMLSFCVWSGGRLKTLFTALWHEKCYTWRGPFWHDFYSVFNKLFTLLFPGCGVAGCHSYNTLGEPLQGRCGVGIHRPGDHLQLAPHPHDPRAHLPVWQWWDKISHRYEYLFVKSIEEKNIFFNDNLHNIRHVRDMSHTELFNSCLIMFNLFWTFSGALIYRVIPPKNESHKLGLKIGHAVIMMVAFVIMVIGLQVSIWYHVEY